jgi:hypothetical protein
MARCVGIEPTFIGLESIVLPLDEQRVWWSMPGSNRPPIECKSIALPDELIPRKNGGTCRIRTYGRVTPTIL